MNLTLKSIANEIRQLVCILNASRHPDCSRPVLVVETLKVCQLPKQLLRPVSRVLKYCEVGWCASALGNILRGQEEIKVLGHNP